MIGSPDEEYLLLEEEERRNKVASISNNMGMAVMMNTSESMPNNVSESDYHGTLQSFGVTAHQLKNSIDNRSSSKLSADSSIDRRQSIINNEGPKNLINIEQK